ncbi:hypothetical protein [Microcystis phage Mae-JY24]
MGYYTEYSLTWEATPSATLSPQSIALSVAMQIEECGEASYALTPEGQQAEASRWYEHEGFLESLSSSLPGVVFTLEGHGEERHDLWRKYAYNGAIVDRVVAVLSWPTPKRLSALGVIR